MPVGPICCWAVGWGGVGPPRRSFPPVFPGTESHVTDIQIPPPPLSNPHPGQKKQPHLPSCNSNCIAPVFPRCVALRPAPWRPQPNQTKSPPPLSFPVIHHAPGPPPTPRGPRGVVRIQPIFPPPHTSAESAPSHIQSRTQRHPPHLLPPPPTQAAESARARARNNHIIILHPSIYPR